MATIITKNSSTASAVPSAGSLTKGELAVNVTDKKLYTKDNSGNVVVVGQEPLISGTNIKTVDGNSILGSGDIDFKTVAGQVVSGTGNIDVVTPGAVTTSNLTMSTNRLLGRTTAATGAIEEISVGNGLSLSSGTLVNSAGSVVRIIDVANTNTGVSSTTLSITKPSSVVSGDLLVAVLCSDNNATWTGDTDWIEIADDNRIRIAYKIAGGSEGASYTFTASTSVISTGVLVVLRNASYDTIGSIGTGTSAVAGSINPASFHGYLFSVFYTSSNSTTIATPTGSTWNPLFIEADASNPSSAIFIREVLSKQATGTVGTATALGANGRAVQIAVKPT